jgi:DNA anti-recombination protein RmuC
MEWLQFAIILVTFVGLFIWNRAESRADIRHMDTKLESNRNLSLEINKENKEIIQQIRDENREISQQIRDENREISQQIRDETQQMITVMRNETQQMITAIHEDIKDFHGRLCAIEERNRGK